MNHDERDSFLESLRGARSHMAPLKLIRGLTPELARQHPPHSFDSCWELLHHMYIWQDVVIRTLKGGFIDWKEVFATDWIKQDQMQNDGDFYTLVKNFTNGLIESKKLIETINMDKLFPFWEEFSGREGILIILQHNSYHIGQLIAVRRILGFPPEGYKIPNH